MSVLRVVIFCVFAIFSVKCLPATERPNFSSEKLNEAGDKEYKGDSGIRTISSLEKEFVVFGKKLPWNEARDACLEQGMSLASPETDIQMRKLEKTLTDNDLVPVDQFSGYWIGGKRDFDAAPFTWQYTGNSVGSFGWLPGEPNYFTGEDCIEFKNDGGALGLNNLYCHSPRGYICEKTLSQEYLKNSRFGKNENIHEEKMKYAIQDVLNGMRSDINPFGGSFSISSASDATNSNSITTTDKSASDSSTTEEIDTVANTTPQILAAWERTPELMFPSPVVDYNYNYDDYQYSSEE